MEAKKKYKYLLLVESRRESPSLVRLLAARPLDFHQDIVPYWVWRLAQDGSVFDPDQDCISLLDPDAEEQTFVEPPPGGYDLGPGDNLDDLVEG